MMRHALPPRLLVALLLAFSALNATAFLLLERRATTFAEREDDLVAALDASTTLWQRCEPPRDTRIVAYYSDDVGDGRATMKWTALGKWHRDIGLVTTTTLPDGSEIDVLAAPTRPKAWTLAPEEDETPSNALDASLLSCYTSPHRAKRGGQN